MEFIKQKIIVISDLEHSKPRIPNLLFHLNNDVYDKYIIGANNSSKKFNNDLPKDFLKNVTLLNFKRRINLFKSIKGRIQKANINKTLKINYLFNTIKKAFMKIILEVLFPDQYFFTVNQYIKLFRDNFNPEENQVVVISSSPYPTVHLVGNKLKKIYKNRIIWIADYRDLWSLNHFYNKTSLRKIIESNYEKKNLKSADLVTTVSEELAKKQSDFLNKKVEVIYNGYSDNTDESTIDETIYLESNKLNIIYTGSLYFDFMDVEDFLKSITHLNENIVFHFYGKFSNALQSLIEINNLGNIVKQRGLMSNTDILKLQKSYDYLLFFDVNYNVKGLYSLKFYEYIKSQRPIICVGKNQLSSIKKLILDSGRGFVFDYANDLVKFLNNNLESPDDLDETGVLKFSYKNQSKKLDLEIQRLLDK